MSFAAGWALIIGGVGLAIAIPAFVLRSQWMRLRRLGAPRRAFILATCAYVAAAAAPLLAISLNDPRLLILALAGAAFPFLAQRLSRR